MFSYLCVTEFLSFKTFMCMATLLKESEDDDVSLVTFLFFKLLEKVL